MKFFSHIDLGNSAKILNLPDPSADNEAVTLIYLNNQLNPMGADIATNATAITTNADNIVVNASDIATNTSGIATSAVDIATNTSDITTNTNSIATNTSGIAINAADIAAISVPPVALQEADFSSGNYTVVSGDKGKNFILNPTSAKTITLPGTGLDLGFEVVFYAFADVGITINSIASFTGEGVVTNSVVITQGQYCCAQYVGTIIDGVNEFWLISL